MVSTRTVSPARRSRAALVEALEARQLLATTYTIQAPGSPINSWTKNWSNALIQTNGWTGADGVNCIPMNGNTKLGSAYGTAGWQMWTFEDSLLGSYDPSTGQRTGSISFVNNTAAMQNTSGATPGTMNFKWRGTLGSTPQEQMPIITRPNGDADSYYWTGPGVVLNGSVEQVSGRLKNINGVAVAQGVTVTTGTATGANNTTWPYSGTEGSTWFSSDNRFGLNSARNVFLSQANTPDPTGMYAGDRVMTAAMLNLSNTTTAYQSTGYVYAYGTQNGSGIVEKYGFVARAAAADFGDTSKWQFWNGSAWVGNGTSDAITSAAPIKDTSGKNITDLASEFGVFQMPDGRLAMVYSQNDAFGGGKIAVRYAAAGHPEGGWSAPTVVYTISTPDTGNSALSLRAVPSGFSGTHYWTYGVKVISQLSKAPTGTGTTNAGKLLISFHVGTYGSSGLGPEFAYGDIYRPRFVELDLVGATTTTATSTTGTFSSQPIASAVSTEMNPLLGSAASTLFA